MQNKRANLDFDYFDLLEVKEVDGLGKIPLNDFIGKSWINDETDALWVKNYKANREKIKPPIKTYKGKDKVCILVGASPAINKQLETLKRLKYNDNFIILSSNTVLRRLIENGIEPDYAFAIEARNHIVEDLDVDAWNCELVCSPFVDPNALSAWKGPVSFYILGGGKKYSKLLKEDLGGRHEIDIGGGNVVSTSMLWAYKYLQCRKFIFIGTSLCYYDDRYYHDNRSTEYVGQDISQWKGKYQALDIYGKAVDTTPALTMYKVWLETFMRHAEGVDFLNCTEDGILGVYPEPVSFNNGTAQFKTKYIPWINIVPLKTAIMAFNNSLIGGKNNEP